MAGGQLLNPDLGLIKEVKKAGGENLKKCYQCATCSAVCNLSPGDNPFPRKEMILAQWGHTEKLVKDPDLWMCYQCNDCTTYCPRGARPGDVLAAIRTHIYRNFAFPSFMGRAVGNPGALPVLLLIPVAILLASIFLFAPTDANGDFIFMSSMVIDFDFFLRHSAVDALFVFGNILIFLFAAVGFARFWRGLKSAGHESSKSFFSALIETVKEIITHSSFNKCETNRPRVIGHMLLFYGFIGAVITTGSIFILIFLPHYLHEFKILDIYILPMPPINLPNPIKIIGGLSGLSLCAGGLLLIVRRWKNKDDVGANGYSDYLFLYMIALVGLTGMLSWLTRLIGIPMLAYVNYFLHLVVVFFLLWYMPYSKFAHMIYRTLALVHCRSIGRSPAN